MHFASKYAQLQQTIKDRYSDFEVPYNGTDNDDYVNGDGFCCDDNPKLRAGAIGNGNDNPEIYQYYYHSDHLGSTSLITDLDGGVVQHVEYVPFGEVFIEERNNKWNTPYLFNAKELDEETGLYYYGARYYDPRVSVWLGADPMQEKYPNISSYAYCHNSPLIYVDPDGQFPILINGRVSKDSERASMRYWDRNVRETIKSRTGYYYSQFMYVDGDRGMWANSRMRAGLLQGRADAASVYARMKRTMVDGKITEQLQVISHSRGAAFANGYMQGLTAEIQELAEADKISFAYGADNIVQYSVNLAPHQSNSINYPNSGATNVNVSHYGDPLSGNDAKGNVINIHSNTDVPGVDQHGIATYNRELDFILQILEEGGNIREQIRERYRDWDRTQSRGLQSTVE